MSISSVTLGGKLVFVEVILHRTVNEGGWMKPQAPDTQRALNA